MTSKKSTNSLIAIMVLILILVAGYLIIVPGEREYILSNEELLENVLLRDYEIQPSELAETGDDGYFIIDVRTPHQFRNAHIPGAVNIPVHDFLEKENLKMFDELQKNSVVIVIYGTSQLQANGGWMFLKQMGYDNIRMMPGGYAAYAEMLQSTENITDASAYSVEEPIYDFAAEIEKLGGEGFQVTEADQPEIVVPVRKKKKSVVEGGC
jgi:rhodanese-related sulfurtransferase